MLGCGAPSRAYPATAFHVRGCIEAYVKESVPGPHAVVATATLRPVLAEFFEQTALHGDVFAYMEIPSDVLLEPAGIIDAPPDRAA